MKTAFLGICVMLIAFSCSTQSTSTEGIPTSNAEIQFEESSFDFGTMEEGEVVSHSFKFKNIGTDPLEIIDVQVSCGCTVAGKPMGLVGVGQSDAIEIQFNSKGKVGTNNKSVGVISNAKNNQEVLKFTAIVKAKPETE